MIGLTRGRALLGAALLSAGLAPAASAQVDPRWAAFLGCWVPAGAPDDAGLLCFRPSGAGLEMFNVVNGAVAASEPLVADGVARPVTAEGCTGTERVEFSANGVRAFTRSEFTCGGESRGGSGVMSFVTPGEWIDVRALSVAGEPVAWVQRYEIASADLAALGIVDPAAGDPNLVRAARIRAAREIEVADVEEAATRLDARAVEVWVAAHETRFALSGSELVRLVDGGVPESVIDVMVAVSYPERFMVSPEGATSEAEAAAMAGGYPAGYPVGARRGYRSYLFDPFYGGGYRYSPYYSRYGYGNGFGYYGDGFGGYGGGYGGYWGYVPATIIVQPATPQPTGRMVPGRGYTRDTSSGGSSSGGASPPAQSSGSGGGGGSSGGGDSSSGGGGGGGGGGSSSSGRTAQPRN